MNDNEVNGTEVQAPAPAIAERSIVVIAIAVTLELDQEVFEVKIREPGIIRAVGFWLKVPKVLGSSTARKIEPRPMPELFVECDPQNDSMRLRRFAFIASNRALPIHAGYELRYVGTAIRANEVGHLYEINEVPS